MNSAFPRISQPVSSDRRRSRINGGSLRVHQCPSMSQSCDLNLFAKLLSRFSLFDSVFLRIPTCHSQLFRAKSSILFHSSAVSWSFAAPMFSSRCASDDVPGIAQYCSFLATPLSPNECKRHAGERALRSLSFGIGHL